MNQESRMHTIVERVKWLVLKPKETWIVIQGEESPSAALISNFLIPLAGAAAFATFVGRWIVGIPIPFAGVYRFSFGASLLSAFFQYLLYGIGICVAGMAVSRLAPYFGMARNDQKGFLLSLYSFTPLVAAGLINLLPSFSNLIVFAGLYGLYILSLGIPILMTPPKEKALPYTILVILVMVILYWIIEKLSWAFLTVYGPHLPKV
jgi:hypothetical protein